MPWAGYDEWRVHGNTHRCDTCGNTWQDFEGGCTYCAENEPETFGCYFCGREYQAEEEVSANAYNDNDGGSICQMCIDERS